MDHFLLDTNVFFNVIGSIRKNSTGTDILQLKNSNCYISELTRIEVISVLGKYARGASKQTQTCDRIINEHGKPCGKTFYTPPKKGWKRRVLIDWIRLVKSITTGNNPFFTVEILPVTQEVCNVARTFIHHAIRYNFGSLDAMIAATAIEYKNRTGTELTVVTYDKKLLTAIQADGTIPYLNPQNHN